MVKTQLKNLSAALKFRSFHVNCISLVGPSGERCSRNVVFVNNFCPTITWTKIVLPRKRFGEPILIFSNIHYVQTRTQTD